MTSPVAKQRKYNYNSTNPLLEFDRIFPELVDDVTKAGLVDAQNGEIDDAMVWLRKVLEYNVPYGKRNRGVMVVESFRYLVQDKEILTDVHIRLACILGWCVELLQAFFLIADDIMDGSITRRGQPCWYRHKGVGLIAVNDSLFVESCIYSILKQHFRNQPYYIDLYELFHETTLQTVTGQTLDLITAPTTGVDFTHYNIDRYNSIVKWKTAFYSFYLPVACAMNMAGIKNTESYNTAKAILLRLGEYFQIQDDYLDCYGDPLVTGKVGTDIEDNKCSWLIVQALSLANENQLAIIKNNYAVKDAEKVKRVKAVFDELDLRKRYADYEEKSYEELCKLIEALDDDRLPKEMFVAYVNKIHKRQK